MYIFMSYFLIFTSLALSVKLESKEFESFTFGSCNKQNRQQPLWSKIIKDEPDLFLWLGDNIYGDSRTREGLKKKYDLQNAHPGYQKLKSKVPISGIWDDHDYGANNGDSSFVLKEESQELFQDFIDIPRNSKLRGREGVYQTFVKGEGDRKVRFILLDNRYFLNARLKKYFPVLGFEQWLWLEDVLKNSDEKINIIASGMSIIGPKLPVVESYRKNFQAHKRIINLVQRYPKKGVFFLVGDRHFSAIHRYLDYYEIMSSGLTHVSTKYKFFLKLLYNGPALFERSYGHIRFLWDESPLVMEHTMKTIDEKNKVMTRFLLKDGKWRALRR